MKTWEPLVARGVAAITKDRSDEVLDASSQAPATPESTIKTAEKHQRPLLIVEKAGYRWVWEYCGPEERAPLRRVMFKEPLGCQPCKT